MEKTPQWPFDQIREAKDKRLKELVLSNVREKLTEIPSEVFELEWLEKLNLSGNKLTTVPKTITKLHNLTELYLRGNQLITVPETITQLHNLTELDLSDNQLTTVPKTITQLHKLKLLNLRGNQLKTVPETITQLHNLTELDLRGNQLITVPETITQLHNLTELDLSGNQLKTVPETITQLHNLTELDLSDNQLTTVPAAITKLHNLTRLDLSGNQLITVPETITQLHNLTRLYLSSNQLKTVPETITQLHNLTELDLSGNQLTTVPKTITQLHKLKLLNLSGNQLTTVPETITQLHKLTWLDLSDNPIETPPLEVVNKGIEAIKEYFQQLAAEGVDYLYEAKLLIIGEGGAGKTTLANKITDSNYQLKEEDTTKGIEVIPWYFQMEDGREFRVNIWDFGGQEIYHATHQFFLTKRSLYALVADIRKEDTDFSYWLNVVELLSDNSPLLIIKNEKQNRKLDINESQLRGQFQNLKATLPTNLATNRGLNDILREIKHYITSLPHIGSQLPKTWVRVREAVESDHRNYISLDEYLNICQSNGFTQLKDKLQLSGYLHDLGVCLHFQADALLKKTVILKPKWGTDAVYKVLDNEQVKCNLGKFTQSDLANIWYAEEYAMMHDELLRLMINFKLCYEIPTDKGTYIAPQLLSKNQPKYPWDDSTNLILRYTYDFMPKGIITQFIVAMHRLIHQQRYVWRNGVIISQNETQAEIIENYSKREIKIRVTGKHKRDLLTIVTHELDKIHNSYQRLKYNKLIPCNCSVCKNQQKPHFYKFESLNRRISDNKYQIECDISYEQVEVWGLIDDVMDRGQLLHSEKPWESEIRNNSSVHIAGNVEQVVILPKQENKIMPEEPKSEVNPKSEGQVTLPWAFRNGMFYLFIFVVVFCLLAFFGGQLPFQNLALIIIGTVIFIILIGVLQLRQDDRLSEKSFVDLVKMVLRQLPLIGNLMDMVMRNK